MNRSLIYHQKITRKYAPFELLTVLLSLISANYILFRSDLNLTMSLLWIIILFLNPFYSAPLVAGEWSAGTDSLLFTLPFSDRKTVFYLFFKGYFALLKIIIPVIAGLIPLLLFKSEDLGQFFVSWVGILGGTALLTSSGLCLSSLFKKTAPAWFVTLVFQGVLFLVPSILGLPMSSFFMGYLSFRHIILFAALFFLFLMVAFIVLRIRREGSIRKTYIVLLELILIVFLSHYLPGGMDLTLRGHNRLNNVTARKIRSLEDKLFIRWYHTDNLELLFPQIYQMEYFLDSMTTKGLGRVHVSENKNSSEIIDLGKRRSWSEQTAVNNETYEPLYSALEIEYRGITETLPLVYDPVIAEEQILAALQRLVEGSIPEIGIISGRQDRSLNEFWTILTDSLQEYYAVQDYTGREDQLLLKKPAALFVLDGRDLSSWAASRIMEYGREGGSVLAALSPLELSPQQSDLIEYGKINPLIRELNEIGISWGESYILDEKGALYLSSGDSSAPTRYPLWFRTSQNGLYDYDAFWSVPLFYMGDVLWKVSSSNKSTTAGLLTNISPQSLSPSSSEIMTRYDTALAITLEKGILVVVSGSESLSNLMALSPTQNYNGAWIQTLAFFLTDNQDLITLRKQTMGVH